MKSFDVGAMDKRGSDDENDENIFLHLVENGFCKAVFVEMRFTVVDFNCKLSSLHVRRKTLNQMVAESSRSLSQAVAR